ncbi:MAG: hypothetical protein C0507_24025 [Cyanobacteria bacterium PR.3.49]|nr:hypothetical protein [Cyanobacteria bacterium PR.3.49]
MLNKLSVVQKCLLLVLLPVILELSFVAYLSAELASAQAGLKTISEQRETLVLLQSTHISIVRTLMALYLPIQHTRHQMTAIIDAETGELEKTSKRLEEIAKNSLSRETEDVRNAFTRLIKITRRSFDEARGIINDPHVQVDHTIQEMNPIYQLSVFAENRRFTREMGKFEAYLRKHGPEGFEAAKRDLQLTLTAGIAAGVLVSLLLWKVFSIDITKRIRRISEQADNVFRGKPPFEPQNGTDEIAQLDKTLYQSAQTLLQTRLREKAILDNAADVICSLDARFRFSGVSAVSEKCWKRKESELLGAPIAALITEDTVENTLASLRRIASEGSGEFENRIELAENSFGDFLWSVRWSRQEKLYFCTVHDVTELRAVEKLKEKFVAIVSHDLRAPITSVGISLNLLSDGKRGNVSPGALSILKRAESSLSTLTILVNELLDLEKLESGKISLNSSVVNVRDVCLGSIETLRGMAKLAKVELELADVDCTVWADQLRLTQALTNLISNAIKFSEKNGTVRIEPILTENDIEVQVIDQGPGVPDEDKLLIFDKFKQSSTKSNLQTKSSGLGLTIVKAIAQAHNGSIGVKDAPAGGSIFFIKIPRISGQLENEA